jgi:hypothetical protein
VRTKILTRQPLQNQIPTRNESRSSGGMGLELVQHMSDNNKNLPFAFLLLFCFTQIVLILTIWNLPKNIYICQARKKQKSTKSYIYYI